MAVADAYDAMLNDRPHRPARARPEVVAEMTRLAYLSDIIYVPLPYQKQLLSIGDIALDLGAFLLIFFGMKKVPGRDYYKFTSVNRKL